MAYWRLLAGSFGLILLSFYSWIARPVPELAAILRSPHRYVNTTVALYVETVVDSVGPPGFRIRQRDAQIWVRCAAARVHHGDFIALDGIFQPDSTLVLGQYRVAKFRRLKMTVSIFGMIFVFLLLIAALRWRRHALEVAPDA